jgi:branched-chain amino acid transport system substrate-binding protein
MRAIAATMAILAALTAQAHAEWPGGNVKLGVLTDLSGVYSDATGTGAILATRMAMEDCLAAECRGMTIDIVSADHQNKPDIALSIARNWIDNQGVDALVDMSNAAIQLAVPPFVREKNRVAIFAGGTARLSGDACQPSHIVQWMWDTYVQVGGVARRLTKPGTTWYLVTADYAFGHQFEADAKAIVEAAGGRVLGSARHPFPSTDLSSFLLQAQNSGADIIALANAGADTINGIKQAAEFGVGTGRQKLVALYISVLDVKGLGLPVAGGTVLTEGFYWDLDAGTRAFSQRFFARQGAMPSQIQAGLYSAVRHYLKSVATAKSKEATTAIREMHTLPISDEIVRNAQLRPDGRMVHDYYVFQVKKPAESKGPWDLYTLLDTIPGRDAFRPMTPGLCPRLLQ